MDIVVWIRPRLGSGATGHASGTAAVGTGGSVPWVGGRVPQLQRKVIGTGDPPISSVKSLRFVRCNREVG